MTSRLSSFSHLLKLNRKTAIPLEEGVLRQALVIDEAAVRREVPIVELKDQTAEVQGHLRP